MLMASVMKGLSIISITKQTKNKQSAFENIFDYKYHTLSSRIIRKSILGIVTIDLQI